MSQSPSPDLESTTPVPLASQVGGHPGVMTTEDGSLLIKPALPLEVAFYQTVLQDQSLAALRPFVPRFYGTLKLSGVVEQNGENGEAKIMTDGVEDEKDTFPFASLVLENLSYPFEKPNILDIKLGRELYDEDATEEKKARMIKKARESTSYTTGVRLTGFQVYDLSSDKAVSTPREYGRRLQPSDLPDGISRFFNHSPHPSQPPSELPSPPPEREAATVLAPDTMGVTVTPESELFKGTGLPPDILLPLLQAVRTDIQDMMNAFAGLEVRMIGASLLIIYEASWERCQEGLARKREADEDDEDEDGEDDEEEDEDGEEDGEGKKKPGPAYVVKLIDFAHTRLVPGRGPDEGVLAGFETMLRLLDGRIQEVNTLSANESPTDPTEDA